jgi:hypothetical protein
MTACLCDREHVSKRRGGIVHAYCPACEARLLREAFGPVSWHDRARHNSLPTSVVGGIRRDAPVGAESAEASPQLQRLDAHPAATTATPAD